MTSPRVPRRVLATLTSLVATDFPNHHALRVYTSKGRARAVIKFDVRELVIDRLRAGKRREARRIARLLREPRPQIRRLELWGGGCRLLERKPSALARHVFSDLTSDCDERLVDIAARTFSFAHVNVLCELEDAPHPTPLPDYLQREGLRTLRARDPQAAARLESRAVCEEVG